MIQSFNEWLTKTCGNLDDLSTADNLGLLTQEDEAMVVNQLEQFVDRINGILYNVPEEKRAALVERLIVNLARHHGTAVSVNGKV